ncbi:cupin domain-containing protein [candidate division KSB1 bacterium]
MSTKDDFFPGFVGELPEAEISFKGIIGKVLQGEDHQLLFMEINPIGEVPPHKHGAQWGCVLEGEIELTIRGETKTYRKGDTYFIPDGVVHSAVFNSKVCAIDFFADRDRYSLKK